MRVPVVGVMGGGSVAPEIDKQARELGSEIARQGWILLNGGRDAGVMRASAEGARSEGGLVVGILPAAGPAEVDVAPGVDVAVFTDLGEARNNVNVLTADVLVLLPGGAGTLSEAALGVKNATPIVLLGWPEEATPPAIEERAQHAGSIEEAIRLVEATLDR